MAAPIRLASTVPATAVGHSRHHDDRWLSVRAELVSGPPVGALWPPPGRYLLASPRHTFADFAAAVDTAFGRWDLQVRVPGRLRAFDLTSGWHVRDLARDGAAVAAAALVDASHPLGDLLRPGDRFTYTVDLDIDDGGGWRHDCVVTSDDSDPLDLFGHHPDTPAPYYGWGFIPDQFGRYWTSGATCRRGPSSPAVIPRPGS